ncbi:MAG TPA: amidohydrolase family protein [Pyrinomonadaceae bacterium]|nr:amidohydrolase family protein [Pyrinomonadaceae bacterium]
MLKQILACFVLALPVLAQSIPAPVADHHQHVASPAMGAFQKFPGVAAITAKDTIALLDAAGIKKAVLLSIAYSYGRPGREPQNEYEKVKEENDWVGAQAALYPKRLVAFCGFNPLKDYALAELSRCAQNPNTRRGIKLHFGNSDVRLENPEHLEKLKAVFRAANANKMSIVVHLRASISLGRPYGSEQARAFLEELMPLASDITVQVAHLGGSGPGFDDPKADAFMDALMDGISRLKIAHRKSQIRNLWFDVASNAHPSNTPERSALLAKRIRQIGVKRVLYGTDLALGGNLPPRESWSEFSKIGLTKSELKTIAKNRAAYLR